MSAWDNLSIREKAAMMRTAVSNGITNIDDIRREYNEFAEGGPKKWTMEDEAGYRKWRNSLPDNLKYTNDNIYDMIGAYQAGMQPTLEDDGKYHLGSRDPQTGKILKAPYHPTYLQALNEDARMGYYPTFTTDGIYTDTWKGNIPEEIQVPYRPYAKGGNLFETGGPTRKEIEDLFWQNRMDEAQAALNQVPQKAPTPIIDRELPELTVYPQRNYPDPYSIPRGEITPVTGNALSRAINNYTGELKYDLANNKVPSGKYTLPAAVLGATGLAGLTKAGEMAYAAGATPLIMEGMNVPFTASGLSNLVNGNADWQTALEIAPLASYVKPMWNTGKAIYNTGKNTLMPKNIVNVAPPLETIYKIKHYPGYQLKSLMSGNPLEKQISKSGTISVNSIKAHIGKGSNVEKAVVDKVLSSEQFAGKKVIDYNDFRKAVQERLITYDRVPDTGFQEYGLAGLGYHETNKVPYGMSYKELEEMALAKDPDLYFDPNVGPQGLVMSKKTGRYVDAGKLLDVVYGPNPNLQTYTFESPRIPFGNAKHYNKSTLGHSRTYTTPEDPNILHVMESQSDWAQNKPSNLLKDYDIKSLKDWEEEMAFQKANAGEGFKGVDYKEEMKKLEAAKAFVDPETSYLANNYLQRQLQENLKYAAEHGQTKMRYPTSDTAAKIEGYSKERVPTEEYKAIQKEFEELLLGNEGAINTWPMELQKKASEYEKKLAYLDSSNKGFVEEYKPAYKTILKKYEDFPKQYRKLYKNAEVRTVTDRKGNTWYEVDVPENYLNQEWQYALGGNLFADGGIHIKPSHRVRLTKLKARTGKTEAELYNDGNPAHKKMVVFARNARNWHDLGGNLYAMGTPLTEEQRRALARQYFWENKMDKAQQYAVPDSYEGGQLPEIKVFPERNQGEITQAPASYNPIVDAAARAYRNYMGELKYDLTNNIVPGGKYTLPAAVLGAAGLSSLASLPAVGEAYYAAGLSPLVMEGLAAPYTAHGLDNLIHGNADWQTALELTPIAEYAKPIWNTGKAIYNTGKTALYNTADRYIFMPHQNSFTRGIGMTDAGLQDAVTTGVFRGNPRGTEQTAKVFDKMFLKNRQHFRDIVEDTGIPGIESRYQSRTLTKEDFDALKKAAQKYTGLEKTENAGTIRLARGTADPLSNYNTYEDYRKAITSDIAKVEQMPSRIASGEIVPNTELSEPMWFEDESGKMLLPQGKPFSERFGPNSDYLADGTPLSYWYADGRNPITQGHAYAKSNYGVRVNNPEDYQPFMHELHLHPSFFRSPKFADPNVEIFGKGPLGLTVKLDKETLQPLWKKDLSNIFRRRISTKTPQITAENAASMTPAAKHPMSRTASQIKEYVDSPKDITSDVGELIAEGSERSVYSSKTNPNIVYKIEDGNAALENINNIKIRSEITDDIIAPETTIGYYKHKNGKYYRVTQQDKYKSFDPDNYDVDLSPELNQEIINTLEKAGWKVEIVNGAAKTASKNGKVLRNLEHYNWGIDSKGNLKLIDQDAIESSKPLLITSENASSITPAQWTAAQDAAIARGDMAEAQRLRDLHASLTPTATPGKYYRGTNTKRNSYPDRHIDEEVGEMNGIYLTKKPKYAKTYGDVEEFYLRSNNPLYTEGNWTGVIDDATRAKIENAGYDAVVNDRFDTGFLNKLFKNSRDETITFDGRNIKLADAVTYDDNGVRIPLGKRDNFKINDIRYGLLPFLGLGTAGTLSNQKALGGNLYPDGGKKKPLHPNVDRAMQYFMDKGFTDYQAAGLVGNFMRESSLNHRAENKSSKAYGLAQWLGDRKTNLFKRYGNNPTFEQQLDYVWDELNSTHKNGLKMLKASKSAEEAARNAMGYYEFSAGPEKAIANMIKHGQDGEGSMRKGVNFAMGIIGQSPAEYIPQMQLPPNYNVLQNWELPTPQYTLDELTASGTMMPTKELPLTTRIPSSGERPNALLDLLAQYQYLDSLLSQ